MLVPAASLVLSPLTAQLLESHVAGAGDRHTDRVACDRRDVGRRSGPEPAVGRTPTALDAHVVVGARECQVALGEGAATGSRCDRHDRAPGGDRSADTCQRPSASAAPK